MRKRAEAVRAWAGDHPRLVMVLQALVGTVIGGGLVYLVFTGLEWRKVWGAYQGLSLSIGLMALAVYLLALLFRALRWRLLFLQEKVGTWRLFQVQNAGIGLNNLLPVRVASEAVQFFLLTTRDRVSGGTALATLLMERVLDIVATVLLLGAGLLLLPQLGGIVGFGPQMAFVGLLAVLWVAGIRFFAWGSRHLRWMQRVPLLYAFGKGVADLERHWPRTLASLLLTVLFWALIGVSGWVLGRGMGLPTPLAGMVVVAVGGTLFATSLPGLPGAVGTFEFAVVYLLALFGVAKEEALSLALLFHVLLFLPSTLIAAAVLTREGWRGVRLVPPVEVAPRR